MLSCTPADFWLATATYVLPPLGALLSATALWVAARARTISEAARSTSLAAADRSNTLPASLDRRARSTEAGEQ